jgi:hypothetical protein
MGRGRPALPPANPQPVAPAPPPTFRLPRVAQPTSPPRSQPTQPLQPPLAQVPLPASPNFDPALAHDVQLGQIFTNMRLAMKVSRETIARRLATSTFIIEAFETGTVPNLPHWRETARIVRGYCELLRLDPEPILWRIKSHYHASGLPLGLLAHDGSRPAGAQSSGADVPAVTRTQAQSVSRQGEARAERRRRRRRGRLLVISAPVLLAGLLTLAAQRAPGPVYSLVGMMPDGARAPLTAVFNALVETMAPTRDGLRWVELSDPQLRKSDKLQTSRR